MGISGSYAGQLFGLLVGFGLAQLKTTLTNGPQPFPLFSDPMGNLLDIIIIFVSLINLVLTATVAIKNNFTYTKTMAYIIGALYGVMFVAVTAIQIYYIVDNVKV